MILPPHASLIRAETIRVLLANGMDKVQVAHVFGVTRQAIYTAVDRLNLDQPLQPFGKTEIARAPYLQLALDPTTAQRLVDARIVETLLGRV